ncbi:MAG: hypothetical protein E7449_01225 [Ruminococcaceae bacterium]|nr:hypothetical protein [Oscillospiraceae bacterium]
MDYSNFRSAIGGFRRSDVFAYIERTSQEHRQALRELEKKNAALQAENDALKAQLASMQPQPAPTVEPTPVDLDAQELAAYRRAEAAERNARRRIAKLNEQVAALSAQTDASLTELDEKAQALAAQATALLTELKESVAAFGSTFEADDDNA